LTTDRDQLYGYDLIDRLKTMDRGDLKALKEPLARMANKEDCCKGTFWESRYKSKPLQSEFLELAAMRAAVNSSWGGFPRMIQDGCRVCAASRCPLVCYVRARARFCA
jgi:hypothetical protein